MTPQLNLLPASYVERIADRRRAATTAVALVVVLVLLALAGFGQSGHLRDATHERDVEQARITSLRAQRVRLAPYRKLAEGVVVRKQLVATTMRTQVSWAALFGSLSSTFPADTSLTSLSAESTSPAAGGGAASPKPGDVRSVIGSIQLEGYSAGQLLGVQRLLQLLALVTGLSRPRLQEGAVDQIDGKPVTKFDGTSFVDAAVLTGRYVNGLPPEYDVRVPLR